MRSRKCRNSEVKLYGGMAGLRQVSGTLDPVPSQLLSPFRCSAWKPHTAPALTASINLRTESQALSKPGSAADSLGAHNKARLWWSSVPQPPNGKKGLTDPWGPFKFRHVDAESTFQPSIWYTTLGAGFLQENVLKIWFLMFKSTLVSVLWLRSYRHPPNSSWIRRGICWIMKLQKTTEFKYT